MIRALIVIAAVSVAAAPGAAEPPRIELKPHVYVNGPTVNLGDIAEVSGDEAGELELIEIAPAANPGASRKFSAAIVMNRLARSGVPQASVTLTGATQVSATTIHVDVSPETIADTLRDFILHEMPWDPREATVDIYPPASSLYVSDGNVDIVWRSNPQYDYLGTGSFRGEVLVDGRMEKSFYAKARVEAYEPVVVAARDISRGERLTESNLRLAKRALSALNGGSYFAVDDLQGMVARGSIFRDQVVTDRKVDTPEIIKRGQIVTIETRIGSLAVMSEAKALSAAAAGDYVTCESLSSKLKLGGILRADGVVVVE